jgi:hypothetical protein
MVAGYQCAVERYRLPGYLRTFRVLLAGGDEL